MASSIVMAGGEQLRVTETIGSWIPISQLNHMVNNSPFYRWMKENRRVKRGGVGDPIYVTYRYSAAGNARMTGVHDPFVSRSRVQPRGRCRGIYHCAELLQTYSIPNREGDLQGNMTRVLNAVEAAIDDANDQWVSDLHSMFWAAETDATSAGDEATVASIRTLVNKATSAGANTFYGAYLPHPAQSTRDDGNGWVTGTHGPYGAGGASCVYSVGGLDRRTVDWGVQLCCPVWYQSSTGITFGRLIFNQMLTAGSVGSELIDIMFVGPNLFDGLLGVLQSQQILQPSKMADYGFNAFRWRNVEFLCEENLPTGSVSATSQALGLCTRNLALVCALEEPRVVQAEATDANVRDYRVSDYMQLVPRRLGRGLGVRATCILNPTS